MLPPLTSLRTFEVAARHLSFTKAAAELCVTQSAVSRQISVLEDFLGVKLFDRQHRAISLTAEGDGYKRELVEIFSRLDRATRTLNKNAGKEILNVQVYTTFAMKWLIPRLKHFQDKHPEIRVHLTASLKPFDVVNTDTHCAVRAGTSQEQWSYRADRLCIGYLIPVCSPELAAETCYCHPEDLREATLLHSMGRPHDWNRWFDGVGLSGMLTGSPGHVFESSSMAYQAAYQHLGYAIGQTFLIADDIRKGLLVDPIKLAVAIEETYFFLTSPRYVGTAKVEIFRDWILEEAREHNKLLTH